MSTGKIGRKNPIVIGLAVLLDLDVLYSYTSGMGTENRPSNPEDADFDLLAEGAIEELVKEGRIPFSLGGFVANEDGTSHAIYHAYIPPAGFFPDDEVRRFDDNEIMFIGADGTVKGFAISRRISLEQSIVLDTRARQAQRDATRLRKSPPDTP